MTAPALRAPVARPVSRGSLAIALIAALLVGINLRPALTTVSALLQTVTAAYSLSPSGVILLSALPIAAFGLTAPFVPWVAGRIGIERALLASMLLLAVALWVRATVPALLLPVTFFAGMMIMVGSILLPPFLRSWTQSAFWVGLTTTMFGFGAALGAWLSVPLYRVVGDVQTALALWAVPALVAAVAMVVVLACGRGSTRGAMTVRPASAGATTSGAAATPGAASVSRAPATRPRRWPIAVMFGAQAVLYACVTAWLPLLLSGSGVSQGEASTLLAWFSIAGFVPTVLLGAIASRAVVLRTVAPLTGIVAILGLAGLLLGGGGLAWVSVAALGLAQSCAFGLAMLGLVRGDRPGSSRLSAISQGSGFVAGALISAAFGGLHLATGSWIASVVLLGLVMVVLAASAAYSAADLVRTGPRRTAR